MAEIAGSEENAAVRRRAIARIIFTRVSSQISGVAVTDVYWDAAYAGWIDNPAMFPLVETCIDAADEIMQMAQGE